MSKEAMDFLLGSGGTSASFDGKPPIKYVGRVLAMEKKQQTDMQKKPKFWDDGNPMWQIVFTIDTGKIDPAIENDDGVRRIFAKAQMLDAIREAVRKSGHRGSLVDGTLGVKYVSDGVSKTPGFAPPKVYEAMFTPPSAVEMLDDVAEQEPDQNQQAVEDYQDFGDGPF